MDYISKAANIIGAREAVQEAIIEAYSLGFDRRQMADFTRNELPAILGHLPIGESVDLDALKAEAKVRSNEGSY